MVNYFLKKWAMDHAKAQFDAETLCHMQPANMSVQQYLIDLFAMSCKVADFNENGTNCFVIKGIDLSARHTLRRYWTYKTQNELVCIEFKVELFSSF